MIGAKVDGRIVPIDYKVKNGEIIDIITTNQQDHGPARDWLNIVKTSEARSKIRSWFKRSAAPKILPRARPFLKGNSVGILFSPKKKKNSLFSIFPRFIIATAWMIFTRR